MAKKYFEYSETFRDIDNKFFSGMSYTPNLLAYSNFFQEHIITPEQEYRPDKIAYYLWGLQDLSWVLDIVNDFTNGISEYTRDTTIKYLQTKKLVELGII